MQRFLPSFMKSKETLKATNQSSDLIVATSNTGLATTRSSPEYRICGLAEVIAKDSSLCRMPETSLPNAVVAVSCVSNAVTTIADVVSDSSDATLANANIATNVTSWALSGGAQLMTYFAKFNDLRTAQELLINSLSKEQIFACFFDGTDGKIEMTEEFSPENIIRFMQLHGKVSLQFINSPEHTVEFFDFSKFTYRVGAPAAAAAGVGILAQIIYISTAFARAAGMLSDEEATNLRLASGVVANAPLTACAGRLVETYNTYTLNFLRSLQLIIDILYVRPRNLHNIPVGMMDVVRLFVSAEDMQKNDETIRTLIADPEAHNIGAPVRRRLTSGGQ